MEELREWAYPEPIDECIVMNDGSICHAPDKPWMGKGPHNRVLVKNDRERCELQPDGSICHVPSPQLIESKPSTAY